MSVSHKYGIDFGATNSSIAVVTYRPEFGRHKAVVYEVENFRSPDVDEIVAAREVLRSVVSVKTTNKPAKFDVGLSAFSNSKSSPIKKIKISLLNEYDCNDEVVFAKYGKLPNANDFRASGIIAEILKHLKERADLQLPEGIRPKGVVMGVPVNIYNDELKNRRYRKILHTALLKAGFYNTMAEAEEETIFVDEPIAVAYSYAEARISQDRKVLVFDFGGGTLDLAIVQMRAQTSENSPPHEVLSKKGLRLGGEQLTSEFFDMVFVDKYAEKCNSKYEALKLFEQFDMPITRVTESKSIRKYLEDTDNDIIKFAGVKFFEKIDSIKRQLSKNNAVDFSFRFSEEDRNIIFENVTFLRSDFERIIYKHFPKIKALLTELFSDCHISANDIDEVLLAGGSSMIPQVQELLIDNFGKTKVTLKEDENYFGANLSILTSIAKGLAVAGFYDDCEDNPISIEDIVPHNWGFRCSSGIEVIIEKGTKVKDTQISRLNPKKGRYCDIEKKYPEAEAFVVDVMCNDRLMGTITIPEAHSSKYRLFYVIDPQKGWLVLDIYIEDSQRWIDDVPIENRKINFITYKEEN